LDDGVLPEDDRLQVEREVAVGKADLAAAKAEMEGYMAHMKVEKAGVQMASARVTELSAQVERAETDLARTQVYSPMDGVVMYRYATPGGKRMRGMDDPESATIVSLYNPEKLQVRVDVPLADAAGVVVGMPARIQLSAFPNQTFAGVVTRIVGEADIVRNTLQVKVAIEEPDPRMRPEMLCRVEFLSIPKLGNSEGTSFRASEKVWIPQSAIQEDSKAWVVDPVTQRAESREIKLGSETREGYQVILEGLRPGERVVLNNPAGLKAGVRVAERKGDES
jgi:RND family efflux transporter MFP subunit